MKKFIFSLICSLFIFTSFSGVFAACNYDGSDPVASLRGCKPEGSVTASNNDYTISGGTKGKIVSITNQLILLGSILAVGGVVFAAFLYTTALGDAEKVKHAKSSLKFAIVGFVVMLLSFAIVNAIVNLIFGIGG